MTSVIQDGIDAGELPRPPPPPDRAHGVCRTTKRPRTGCGSTAGRKRARRSASRVGARRAARDRRLPRRPRACAGCSSTPPRSTRIRAPGRRARRERGARTLSARRPPCAPRAARQADRFTQRSRVSMAIRQKQPAVGCSEATRRSHVISRSARTRLVAGPMCAAARLATRRGCRAARTAAGRSGKTSRSRSGTARGRAGSRSRSPRRPASSRTSA